MKDVCEDGGDVPSVNMNGEQLFAHVRFTVYLAQIAEEIGRITNNYLLFTD